MKLTIRSANHCREQLSSYKGNRGNFEARVLEWHCCSDAGGPWVNAIGRQSLNAEDFTIRKQAPR